MSSLATTTFIRVELGRHYPNPPAEPVFVLVNVDHIVRIHTSWPRGTTLVLDDDTSLNSSATLAELTDLLRASNGGVRVLA